MDAEGLMPLNTSDINKTISMEMRMARTMNILNMCHGNMTSSSAAAVVTTAVTTKSSSFVTPPEHIGPNKFTFPSIDAAVVRHIPTANPREMKISTLNSKHSVSAIAVASNNSSCNENSKSREMSSYNADLASVDSSDTFMSCQTHPFLSQGDLAMVDDDDNLCDLYGKKSLLLTNKKLNKSIFCFQAITIFVSRQQNHSFAGNKPICTVETNFIVMWKQKFSLS